jgi:hypothetical protein
MNKTSRVNAPAYSYHKFKSEDKKLYKRIAIILGVTVVIIVVLWFWGISFVQIVGSLDLKNDSGNTSNGISIPLQKPTLSDLPEFTNKDTISVSGNTSPNVQVSLFINGSQSNQATSDTNGNFTFSDVKLKQGLNLIKVSAKDKKGETENQLTSVTYDNVAPALKITQPTDGQTLSKDMTNIKVVGSTDSDASVFINSIQATKDQKGGFTYNLNLSPGENKIEVKATDKANNETAVELTITVSQ